MTSRSVDDSPSLLTLGRVDSVRVQVGYRASPDDRVDRQYLLDLSVPEPDGGAGEGVLDERRILSALEPVLYAGADARRHYSLHQHRWHTSWGASPGALEIGLLVNTGPRTTAVYFLERGGIAAGARVLVNGASGEIGLMATQIARARGASVTGVTRAANATLVRRLGANGVVDHTREPLSAHTERYVRRREPSRSCRGTATGPGQQC